MFLLFASRKHSEQFLCIQGRARWLGSGSFCRYARLRAFACNDRRRGICFRRLSQRSRTAGLCDCGSSGRAHCDLQLLAAKQQADIAFCAGCARVTASLLYFRSLVLLSARSCARAMVARFAKLPQRQRLRSASAFGGHTMSLAVLLLCFCGLVSAQHSHSGSGMEGMSSSMMGLFHTTLGELPALLHAERADP